MVSHLNIQTMSIFRRCLRRVASYGVISEGVERMGNQGRTEEERSRPRRTLLRVLSEIAETASHGTPTRAATPAIAARPVGAAPRRRHAANRRADMASLRFDFSGETVLVTGASRGHWPAPSPSGFADRRRRGLHARGPARALRRPPRRLPPKPARSCHPLILRHHRRRRGSTRPWRRSGGSTCW